MVDVLLELLVSFIKLAAKLVWTIFIGFLAERFLLAKFVFFKFNKFVEFVPLVLLVALVMLLLAKFVVLLVEVVTFVLPVTFVVSFVEIVSFVVFDGSTIYELFVWDIFYVSF